MPCTSTGAVFGCLNEAVPWTLDVNGDGVLDVILPPEVWRPEYQAWTYVTKTWTQIPLGLPNDAFPTIKTYVGGGAGPGAEGFVKVPASMAFADVNGDGLRDIVRGPPPAGPDGPLLVFLNTGAGFLPAQPLSVGGSMSFLDFNIASVFDADGDGRDDFLVPASFSDGYEYALVRSVPSASASPAVDGLAYEVQRTHIPAVFPSYANDFDSFQAFAPGRAPRPMNVEGFGAFGFVALGAPDGFGAPTRLEHHRSVLHMPDLLEQVHDGLATVAGGRPRVAVAYAPAVRTVGSPYAPAPAAALPYPAHRFVGPKRLVASYTEDNGNDDLGKGLSQNETTIRYEDGRLALNGRGWLGFARRTETLRTPDGRGRRRVIAEVDNATYDDATKSFPFAGIAKRTATYLGLPTGAPNTVPQTYEYLLEESVPELKPSAGGKSHFVVVSSRRTRHWQLPGPAPADTVAPAAEALEDEVVETQTDSFGNPTSIKKSVQGTLVEETTNVFEGDPSTISAAAPWRPRQLRQTTITDHADDGSTTARVLAHEYDPLGRIARTIRAPGDPLLELSLAIVRDPFGNVVVASMTPAVGTPRQSCTTYDPDGVFPHASRNAEGHVVRSRTDPALGIVTEQMDPNGLITQTAYDGFGRIAHRIHPDGTATSVSLSRQLETTGGDYRTRVEVSSPDGQHTLAMHDSLGRAFRTWRWVMGPSGTPEYVREETRFDALGRVEAQSVPAPETVAVGALKFGRVRYDDAGRPVRYLPISGGDTVVQYVGRDTRTLRGATPEQVTVSSRDARGRLTQVVDAMGGTTTYRYGPFGVLREVESPNGSRRSFVTDPYGRVTSLADPDMGTQVYELDGFDQVVAETDGNGLRSEYTYDRLGRRTRRVDPAGETIFSWDGAPHGIGALHDTLSPDGIRQSATYDSLSRPATTTTTIGDESFVTSFSYNEVGRLSRIDYPSDVGPFSVAYGYDPHGELVRVSGPGNESYWQKATGDYAGRTATELFGNGLRTDRTYQPDTGRVLTIRTGGLRPGEPGNVSIQRLSYKYDATSNLLTRTDHRQLAASGVETFRYDALNRVTEVLDGGGSAHYAYAYDSAGNITSKSDVGAFGYDGTPHAVTHAGAETLTYDGNGNLVQRTTGVTSRAFVYTPFNLPSAVTGVGLGGGVHFKYDAHRQRVVKRKGAETTVYVGQHYERTTRPTLTTARYFVRTPERVIAVVGRTVTPPTSDGGPQIKEAVQFLHTDHNGSVDVVTDGSGAVLERRSYDPFGARRRAQSWTSAAAPDKRVTVVGFTGHMDEDDLGLVNMRGRLYDPKLARFTTPDPFVLRPHGAQGWNRYSYVQNNPGSWIDPSGFGECQIKCSDAAPAQASKDGGHGDARNQGPGACWLVCGGNPPQPGGSRVPTGGGGISLGGGGSSGPPPPPGPRPNGTAPPPVVRATPTFTPPITPRVERGYSFEDWDTYINVYGTKAALLTGGGALLVAGAIGGFVLFEAGALAAAGSWLAGAVAGVTARLGALVAALSTPQVAVPLGTAAATAGAAAMHFGPQLPNAFSIMNAVGSRVATSSPEQFFIENGVRRSLAAREAGLTEIPATIFRPGQAPVNTMLRLDQLFSPKTGVPMDSRFLRIQPPIHTPIQVQPLGTPGQPLSIPLWQVTIQP